MGKGGQIKQAQQATEAQIGISREQLAMMNQLMQRQLAQRDSSIGTLLPGLQQGLGAYGDQAQRLSQEGIDMADQSGAAGVSRATQFADQGLTPEAEAALRSNAMGAIPAQFQNAQSQLQAQLARRGLFGGATPASGLAARELSPLYAAGAGAHAGALRDVILQKEGARRQGLSALLAAQGQGLQGSLAARGQGLQGQLQGINTGFAGVGTLGQVYNPNAFVGGAESSLGAAGQATGQRANLIAPGFWDYAAPVIGAAGGSLLMPGGWLGRPASSTSGGKCWIAEAVWGVNDLRTHMVRRWLNQVYAKTPVGSIVMAAYGVFGKSVAWAVRHSPRLKEAIRPLFNLALARSIREG